MNERRWRHLLIAIFFLAGAEFALGQTRLHIAPLDTTEAFVAQQLKPPASFTDSTALGQYLNEALQELRLAAFLEASIDSLAWQAQDSTYITWLHLGPFYQWLELEPGNVEGPALDASGFRERLYRGRPFRYEQVRRLQERLLDYFGNHGYPFAAVWLDSISVGQGQARAQLRVDRGPLILIKALKAEGEAKISPAFLGSYLGIKPGAAYDNGKVLRIRNRLRELPFLNLAQDPTVNFLDGKATINLKLDKRQASRFDFVIGVLPQNPAGREENNRNLLVTGTFNAELQNQFGLGERIFAKFEQLRPETQQLQLEFNYPYVLGFPFGTDLRFSLYKRDTSFLDLDLDVGLQYLFEGGNYLKAFWNNRSSTLLTINERQLQQGILPPSLDVQNASFGLEYALQRLDYRFNPRKGWAAFVRGSAGLRRIERNNRVVELGYGQLYDSLELRSFQYKLGARLEGYLPLFSRSTLKGGLQGNAIFSAVPVYFNEQSRIGGNRLLRGFDEESIFATRYALATLEYRLLIGQNSYLYAFADYAYVEDKTAVRDITDRPYGFGAGITFETGAGLFGVSLAYGKQLDNPLDFSAPKVHFGYVSLFN